MGATHLIAIWLCVFHGNRQSKANGRSLSTALSEHTFDNVILLLRRTKGSIDFFFVWLHNNAIVK